MKYLRESFGKYFEFKNTINGTAYFLRGTFGFLIFFIPISILFGIFYYLSTILHIDSPNFILVTILGIVILLLELFLATLMFWFVFATTYKRINAFLNKNVGLLTICTHIYSIMLQVLNPNNEIIKVGYTTYLIAGIPYFVWWLYLTFGNSYIERENHIG